MAGEVGRPLLGSSSLALALERVPAAVGAVREYAYPVCFAESRWAAAAAPVDPAPGQLRVRMPRRPTLKRRRLPPRWGSI